MKQIKYNYDVLRVGDIMICGGRGFGSYVVKSNTAGWFARHKKNVSSHSAIVIDFHGRKMIAESKGGEGLVLSSLRDYDGRDRKRFCLGFRRPPLTIAQRKELQQNIAVDLDKKMEYDTRGAMSFNPLLSRLGFKQNKKKPYCSEYVRDKLKQVGTLLPRDLLKGKISPYQLQMSPIFKNISGYVK